MVYLFVKSKGQTARKIFKIRFGQRCPRKKRASNKKMIRKFTSFEVSEKFKGTAKYELPRLLCTGVLQVCETIYATRMNLLSKFCIAVSATQKLNCVAVGVICVAAFLMCFGEKIMLNSVTLSQLNQSRVLNILKKKKR